MIGLSILFGACVGFALGLTGGGGSLFAVPLLVYGLAVAPREAFIVSLAAVGATALVGVIPRIRNGQVELPTGVLFAVAGMPGAPLGTWVAGYVPESMLLSMFSVVMLVVAWRMWSKGSKPTGTVDAAAACAIDASADGTAVDDGPACRRTPDGRLRLTSRCAMLLALVGLATGFLSGMFGVGGGFVIVPALVFFSGMSIHRAVATSLMVIVLVSLSGVLSQVIAGKTIPLEITGLFIVGGIAGMLLGTRLGHRLPAARLQRVFAAGIVGVALFVVSRNLI